MTSTKNSIIEKYITRQFPKQPVEKLMSFVVPYVIQYGEIYVDEECDECRDEDFMNYVQKHLMEEDVIYYFLENHTLTQTSMPFDPKIHEWESELEVDGRTEKTFKMKGGDSEEDEFFKVAKGDYDTISYFKTLEEAKAEVDDMRDSHQFDYGYIMRMEGIYVDQYTVKDEVEVGYWGEYYEDSEDEEDR